MKLINAEITKVKDDSLYDTFMFEGTIVIGANRLRASGELFEYKQDCLYDAGDTLCTDIILHMPGGVIQLYWKFELGYAISHWEIEHCPAGWERVAALITDSSPLCVISPDCRWTDCTNQIN